jgi:hypothetical protein
MLRVRFLLCCRRQRARCFTGMGSDETALSERPSRDTTDPWFGRSDGKAMPSLAAINADEAIALLDARTAAGFHVNYRPGGEPYFYLAVASRSPADIPVNHPPVGTHRYQSTRHGHWPRLITSCKSLIFARSADRARHHRLTHQFAAPYGRSEANTTGSNTAGYQ